VAQPSPPVRLERPQLDHKLSKRKGREEWRLGLREKRLAPSFALARMTRNHRIRSDGQWLPGHFWPRLGDEFPAWAQVAAWDTGRTMPSVRAGCGPCRRAGPVAAQVSRVGQNLIAGPNVQKKIENFIYFRYIPSVLSLILLYQRDKFIRESMST
jgi:hypothetical protein